MAWPAVAAKAAAALVAAGGLLGGWLAARRPSAGGPPEGTDAEDALPPAPASAPFAGADLLQWPQGSPASAAAAAVALASLLALACCTARRRRAAAAGGGAAGVRRAVKKRLVLPARDGLPALPLDVLVAGPPRKHQSADCMDNPLVLYVLDPEPVLFAAAATFAFAQAAYFADVTGSEEAMFSRLFIVGVGHSADSFGLTGDGLDTQRLRSLRRRDFPPWNHKEINPDGAANKHAYRFTDALTKVVVPFVEKKLLGFRCEEKHVRRGLLGASYSAVLALQSLLHHPGTFQHFLLGSPSVCFDTDLLDEIRNSDSVAVGAKTKARVSIFLGAREREGLRLPGNVHDQMAQGAEQLLRVLQKRNVVADGVHELPGEDHSTMKLPFISRALTAFARAQIA